MYQKSGKGNEIYISKKLKKTAVFKKEAISENIFISLCINNHFSRNIEEINLPRNLYQMMSSFLCWKYL